MYAQERKGTFLISCLSCNQVNRENCPGFVADTFKRYQARFLDSKNNRMDIVILQKNKFVCLYQIVQSIT